MSSCNKASGNFDGDPPFETVILIDWNQQSDKNKK